LGALLIWSLRARRNEEQNLGVGTQQEKSMETTVFQAIKLAVVSVTGLSKDALHIYIGLTVYLAACLALRKSARNWWPVLLVVLIACLGEALDMRDDIHSLGHWRWRASLHDVVNTVFWPVVLYLLGRRVR
jgi:hypothetical protein